MGFNSSICRLNRKFVIHSEMPYEEIYFQRLKEEDPEEYVNATNQ